MLPEIEIIKGIHPGAIIKRELKGRRMKNRQLAELTGEFPQTIGAIIKEKRRITPGLSIRLGQVFDAEKEYFLILQACYDIKQAKGKSEKQLTPDLNIIRRAIFWDTDFDKIDWDKNRKALIKRIFERGNVDEIREIIKFYGQDTIRNELKGVKPGFLKSFDENLKKYKMR